MNAHLGLETAAISLLRTLGGGKASLLVPQPVAVDGQCGLGLEAPLSSEVEVEPVLVRTAGVNGTGNGRTRYALMTKCTVHKALNLAQAADSGESATKQTLESSVLRVEGTEYHVRSVLVKCSGGLELLYELEIES